MTRRILGWLVLWSVLGAMVPAKAATTTTSYDTAAKAGALLAQIDGSPRKASTYAGAIKALLPFCNEGPAKIADMTTNFIILHKKKTGRTVKAGNVLVDVLTAIQGNPRKQKCLDLFVLLLSLYDAGLDKPAK